MKTVAALALVLLAACGGGPPRGEEPSPEPAVESGSRAPGTSSPATRYLDEDCVLSADRVFVVVPRALRAELTAEALVGGWEGDVYTGRGRVDVRIRKLRLVTESIEIRLTGGPVANLRVRAEGNARVSATTVARVEEPAEIIILKPDALLIE